MFASKIIYEGKWLHLHRLDFITSSGEKGVWEYISRPKKSNYDGVKVLATIKEEGTLKLVTIAMYRFPIENFVLELPAGLTSKKDKSPLDTATRELKQETGYTAFIESAVQTSPVVYTDPWKSTECSRVVIMRIDEENTENQHPGTAEHAIVHLLPMDSLLESLMKLTKENNYDIDSRLYFFAKGLEFWKNDYSI